MNQGFPAVAMAQWQRRVTGDQAKRARSIAARGGTSYIPARDLHEEPWLNELTVKDEYMAGHAEDEVWVPPQGAIGTGKKVQPDSPEEALSKTLSFLLRHGGRDCHLTFDKAGWFALAELMPFLNGHMHRVVSLQELGFVVHANVNMRFQFKCLGRKPTHIRATQGVSLPIEDRFAYGDPLTADQIRRLECIYHGTKARFLRGILGGGILAGGPRSRRVHIHMSPCEPDNPGFHPVPYTHLTLPTNIRDYSLGCVWRG